MKTIQAKDCISDLNKWKKAQLLKPVKTFSKKQFLEGLKTCGFPSNPNVWRYLIDSDIITPVSKGVYQFPDESPIHFARMDQLLDKMRSDLKQKRTSSTNKIEAAIQLLKKNGYKVLKEQTIVKYVEV